MGLYGTSRINEKGHLTIGEVDVTGLAEAYGTPLYVYDVKDIRDRAEAFKSAFERASVQYQVAYASKAFSCVAMFQLADELGLSLDVCSGGELYTALEADFPVDRIHFHGNNKTADELEMAVNERIGCIVVDNFTELTWLMAITEAKELPMDVLIRITPGVEAHTHEYISTGQEDSKFGFDLNSGQATKAIDMIMNHDHLHLLGVHSHIGSQIFKTEGFEHAVKEIYKSLEKWKDDLGYEPEVLNVGGGFGIRYSEHDEPLPIGDYIDKTVQAARSEADKRGMNVPEIWIEPGRAMVGEAGTTLYTIGSRKEIPTLRTYLSVDGGMTDNIRPALYQAEYEAVVANKGHAPEEELVSVAGRCCESGDMLIWDLKIPETAPGDLLAVSSTGAYGYAMASNYNRMLRPAVVFVEDGEYECVIERENYADLVRKESRYSKVVPVTERMG
ncbi:diaminopimelate decarboxylase [Salisediminibacterium selenitireducens]|uniref:Diaminopimelate decarboxylase n=1 Tax=Bacillus selenitireducens (strain ATCC 700615 / DSM 15326 / MLS10) TaxID=439292 RepID=D6XVG1_BACIE|nr:diaminopimelate decarboxylase [Salisediminibacterium selenitireducens]ADH99699.1 diaminopimelate decarboxylase [[Bacillus] selenitireducens MLS10]